jgi:hypothetical protein
LLGLISKLLFGIVPLHLVLRAAVLERILQHLEMFSGSSLRAGLLVPWAAMLVRVPQYLEMPSFSSSTSVTEDTVS